MRSARYDAKALTRALRGALASANDVAMFRLVSSGAHFFMCNFTVCAARTKAGRTQIRLKDDGAWFNVATPRRLFIARHRRDDAARCTYITFIEWRRGAFASAKQ